VTTYIALLRAVNVGGRVVKMAELLRVFEAMGFGRIQTYIQSGNVLFASDESPAALRGRIEPEIEAAFGFPVTVVLRTTAELERAVAQCPFAAESASEHKGLYVAALATIPAPEGADRLRVAYNGSDEWRIVGREVYLLYYQGAGVSKLTNALLERHLGVAATSRNWRTITTLARMARGTDAFPHSSE
jgi:uncharacterized protein (DUF1697 family)